MNETEIIIKNLSKSYGKKRALSGVSLTIPQGMFGLLGRNGAGKTTLMKVLVTLLQKNRGTVSLCGVPIENAREIRRMIGYLPQEFSVYPGMGVYEAMDYLGVLSGMDKAARRERIPRLLEQVNLSGQYKTKVKALSGGMKRRLGIAQAMLHDPKVLIVDEPTAGLDPEERIRFRNLLCGFAQERTVLLSTHIVGDIEATCERIAVMDSGKLLYQGSVSELTKLAENRVYQAEIQRAELEAMQRDFLVTGMLSLGGKVHVRVIAPSKPHPSAQLCEPNMEDAYLLKMAEHGVDVSRMGGEAQ